MYAKTKKCITIQFLLPENKLKTRQTVKGYGIIKKSNCMLKYTATIYR